MVSWFKRPGDSKLPQQKEQLLLWNLLTCNRSEREGNHLKEGEEPMSDDQAAGLGNGEVLPAANSGDEGDVADTLLQIATEV